MNRHNWLHALDGAYDSHDWRCAQCGAQVNGPRPSDAGCPVVDDSPLKLDHARPPAFTRGGPRPFWAAFSDARTARVHATTFREALIQAEGLCPPGCEVVSLRRADIA